MHVNFYSSTLQKMPDKCLDLYIICSELMALYISDAHMLETIDIMDFFCPLHLCLSPSPNSSFSTST